MPIKLLLADQSELALIGLRSIFSAVPRVELVGEARDPIQLSALLVRVKPDVVLIDHTAKGFGPDAIREGIHRSKRTRFVAIAHNPSKMALMNALHKSTTLFSEDISSSSEKEIKLIPNFFSKRRISSMRLSLLRGLNPLSIL